MSRNIFARFSTMRSERASVPLAMTMERSNLMISKGVEDDGDEARCREMSATYLQGYKYSRPGPIEQLKSFLQKTG